MRINFTKKEVPDPDHFLRRAGYGLLQDRRHLEKSFVRRLRHDFYPRFHLYVEEWAEAWVFNLHLDQRATVYKGVTAHAGEYDGDLMERETERIRSFLYVTKDDSTPPQTTEYA